MEFNIGDIVARNSYNRDVYFKIEEIVASDSGELYAKLRGLDVRLLADSPFNDLIKVKTEHIKEYRRNFIQKNNQSIQKIFSRRSRENGFNLLRSESESESDFKTGDFFEMPGRVLHIDGNLEYLNLCLALYEQMGIMAKGIHVPENQQSAVVPTYIKKYRPDILVLTGHDGIIKKTNGFSDLGNYHNSKYFVEAVKAARAIESNKDDLIIFAGACQSHYQALLLGGANYASSPLRVFIHAFDPVFIVEKIAFTPINHIVSINEVIDSTITGTDGFGGIETKGKFRRGYPKSPY